LDKICPKAYETWVLLYFLCAFCGLWGQGIFAWLEVAGFAGDCYAGGFLLGHSPRYDPTALKGVTGVQKANAP